MIGNPQRFAVVNVEPLEKSRLLVANIFAHDGGPMVDQIIKPFESAEQAVIDLAQAGVINAWTSTPELFKALVVSPGIGVEFKHPSHTKDTSRAVADERELLITIFDIEPVNKPPEVAPWRRWLSGKLIDIAQILLKEEF